MTTNMVRNNSLALVGLAALTIYILACTSFSPDDKKVLYPALDPQTGAPGVAVYDRGPARSRMLFVPVVYDGTNAAGALVRPQWLGNGQRILAAWSSEHDDGLTVGVFPDNASAAARLFRFNRVSEAASTLMFPVAVAGQHAFVTGREEILKLNLVSGEILRHQIPTNQPQAYLFPGGDGENLFYLEEETAGKSVFGRFNPQTFERAPAITFTNKLADGSFFTLDEQGRRIAFVEQGSEDQSLVILEAGQPALRKPLPNTDKVLYGNAVILTRKNLVLASFMRPGTNTSSFGLMEISYVNGPVRETVLIRDAPVTGEAAQLYFQAGVSHDGRMAAVSSAYLACLGENFRADDCALFLVDLRDANRKVTKFPIKMPLRKVKVAMK